MTGNIERLGRRKRQARLTFDPIDRETSSAGRMAPARVRYERPGKVTLKQTPSSSRIELGENEDQRDRLSSSVSMPKKLSTRSPFKLLPTPAKSSQVQPKVPSSAERSDTLELDSDSSPAPRKRQPRNSNTFGKTRSRGPAIAEEDNSSDGSALEDIAPQQKRRTPTKSQIVNLISDSEDEMFASTKRGTLKKATPPKKTPEKKTPKSRSVWGSSSKKDAKAATTASDSEDEISLPALRRDSTPSRRPKMFGSGAANLSSGSNRRRKQPVFEGSDTDSDDIVSSPKRSQQPTRRQIAKLARKGKGRAQPQELSSDSDIVPTPLKRQRPTAISDDSEEDVSPLKRQRAAPISEDEDEEELVLPTKRHRNAPGPVQVSDNSEEDVSPPKRRRAAPISEDEEELVSPTKRRRNTSGPVQISSDEEEEAPVSSAKQRRNPRGLDPMSSSDESVRKSPPSIKRSARQRNTRRHRTEKEKTMELLKRKRAGEKLEKLTSSEDDDTEAEESDDLQSLSDFADEEEEPEQVRKPKKVSKSKAKEREGEIQGDSDLEGFITDDEEGPLGIEMAAIPLQFTHAAHKPHKEHFKEVVEWMIKNKLHPAFPRDDPIYNNAFQKLNDESYGLAKSKFSSTQWTKEFTTAIYARPTLLIAELQPGEGFELGVPKCDACNHKAHVPKNAIQLTGKAYDPRTLVELDQGDSDDEDSDDSDAPKSMDGHDRPIPREETRWAVGPVCMANAEHAHRLLHWKYSLNEWVIDTLKGDGYLTPEKLAERDKMKHKDLNRLADKLVDQWEAQGTIKALYRDYKNQLDEAKNLTSRARGGWK